jgi:hypothetical protein
MKFNSCTGLETYHADDCPGGVDCDITQPCPCTQYWREVAP